MKSTPQSCPPRCKLLRTNFIWIHSTHVTKNKSMYVVDFNDELLLWVVVLLALGMASNRVVGRNYETHDGSISPRMAYFVTMHSRLMDIASNTNRRKAVIDLGSGWGNVTFVAASQSHRWRTVIGIEKVPERVARLREKVQQLIDAGAHFAIPTIVEANFASRTARNVYTAALEEGPIIMWLNNGEDRLLTYEVPHLQYALEDRLRDCMEGSILVSMSRCFLSDRTWHEEGFEVEVLQRDVSWRCRGTGDDSDDEDDGRGTETVENLFKYTKRSFPQPLAQGETLRTRRDPDYERLEFPSYERIKWTG